MFYQQWQKKGKKIAVISATVTTFDILRKIVVNKPIRKYTGRCIRFQRNRKQKCTQKK